MTALQKFYFCKEERALNYVCPSFKIFLILPNFLISYVLSIQQLVRQPVYNVSYTSYQVPFSF